MWRVEGSKTIIIDDNATYIHVLNETASVVWRLSDGEHTIMDIIEILISEYAASEKEAEIDVFKLLEGLAEKKLISFK